MTRSPSRQPTPKAPAAPVDLIDISRTTFAGILLGTSMLGFFGGSWLSACFEDTAPLTNTGSPTHAGPEPSSHRQAQADPRHGGHRTGVLFDDARQLAHGPLDSLVAYAADLFDALDSNPDDVELWAGWLRLAELALEQQRVTDLRTGLIRVLRSAPPPPKLRSKVEALAQQLARPPRRS